MTDEQNPVAVAEVLDCDTDWPHTAKVKWLLNPMLNGMLLYQEPWPRLEDENRLLKIALKIKAEEHDCCADDFRTLAASTNALLHQIDIGDFVDSNGHSAKMLKAVHDLMQTLKETSHDR